MIVIISEKSTGKFEKVKIKIDNNKNIHHKNNIINHAKNIDSNRNNNNNRYNSFIDVVDSPNFKINNKKKIICHDQPLLQTEKNIRRLHFLARLGKNFPKLCFLIVISFVSYHHNLVVWAVAATFERY